MEFDHGVLNVPLSKRGDINAQLDRYKAEQLQAAARKAKAASALHREQGEQAKALVASWSDERCARICLRAGFKLTAKQARKKLLSQAHWSPAAVLAVGAEGGAA